MKLPQGYLAYELVACLDIIHVAKVIFLFLFDLEKIVSSEDRFYGPKMQYSREIISRLKAEFERNRFGGVNCNETSYLMISDTIIWL